MAEGLFMDEWERQCKKSKKLEKKHKKLVRMTVGPDEEFEHASINSEGVEKGIVGMDMIIGHMMKLYLKHKSFRFEMFFDAKALKTDFFFIHQKESDPDK